jgi:hypothetical protein
LFLGPLMGSWIYERNATVLWIVCLVLGFVAAGLALARSTPRTRTEVVSITPAEP